MQEWSQRPQDEPRPEAPGVESAIEPPEQPSPRHSGPQPSRTLAWVVIILSVVGIVLLRQIEGPQPPADPLTANPMLEMQAKIVHALESQSPRQARRQLQQLREMVQTPADAWRLAALKAAVVRDADQIRDEILPFLDGFEDALPDRPVPHAGVPADAFHEIVRQALVDPDALDPAQRDAIIDELDWFGRILLHRDAPPGDPQRRAAQWEAWRVVFVFGGLIGGAIILGLAGLVILIIAIVSIDYHDPHGHLRIEAPRLSPSLYLEAFGAYLALFFVMHALPFVIPLGDGGLVYSLLALSVTSIVGVLWPVLRGAPASIVWRDLGLHRGAGFLREVGAGLVGYMAILPLMGVGIVLTLALAFIILIVRQVLGLPAPTEPTGHPIFEIIAHGDWFMRFAMLFLAAGFAPFFEEIMFRGALWNGIRRNLGPVLALLVMGFIFAIVHPQGFVAVPVLMSLAIGFALLRIWRGSLIAPMTAHAVHNGALVIAMLLIFA